MDGNIISYSIETTVLIDKDDLEYTAVYSENPVEMQPIVRFGGNRGTPDFSNHTITYEMVCNIPIQLYKKEWGLIFTAYDLNEEEFVLGGNVAQTIDDKSEVKNANNAILPYTAVFNSSAFEQHKTVRARVYIIVQDENGEQRELYSDISTVQL